MSLFTLRGSRPLCWITLGGNFDRGAESVSGDHDLYQDQYQDQLSMFRLLLGGRGTMLLCEPELIRFHSKTFSGETEHSRKAVWIKTEVFS